MITTSNPAASKRFITFTDEDAMPPNDFLDAIDRIKTSSLFVKSCIRILSPNMAPWENGEEGSIAITAVFLPLAICSFITVRTNVDLPAPADPVNPIVCALPVNWKEEARISWPIDESDSISVMAFDKASLSPFWIFFDHSVGFINSLID